MSSCWRLLPLSPNGHRGIFISFAYLSVAFYPLNNFWKIQCTFTMITKTMYHGWGKVPIENDRQWPWPWRSFCIFTDKCTLLHSIRRWQTLPAFVRSHFPSQQCCVNMNTFTCGFHCPSLPPPSLCPAQVFPPLDHQHGLSHLLQDLGRFRRHSGLLGYYHAPISKLWFSGCLHRPVGLSDPHFYRLRR